MALAGIARVSQLQLLQLFLTIGFAAVFLGDTLGLDVLIFGAAVSVTVWPLISAKASSVLNRGKNVKL